MNSLRSHLHPAVLAWRSATRGRARRLRAALYLLPTAYCLLVAQAPAAVHAETRGLDVRLSYVRGYSNWGPTNVYGSAKVWLSEGVAMLSVHNLPHLLNGDSYAWWLVNTSSGDALPLGAFNTSEAGDAAKDNIFNQAPPQGADALVVTVMHPNDPAAAPGPLRTLAGYFPAQTAPAGQSGTQPARPSTPARPPHQAAQPPARQHTTHPPVQHHAAHPPARQPVAHGTRGTHGTPKAPPAHHGSGASHHSQSSQYTAHRIVALPHTGGGPAARPCPRPGHRHGHACTRA